MVVRPRVARTRLTVEESEIFEAAAREAGVTPSEYLRSLIVGHRTEIRDLLDRVVSLETRFTHVEEEISKMWSEGGSQ
jgi:hypothetical protein